MGGIKQASQLLNGHLLLPNLPTLIPKKLSASLRGLEINASATASPLLLLK